MKQSPRDKGVFQGIDRVETRLTIFDWPERPELRLEEAVAYLAGFEAGNGEPVVLTAEGARHLAWEGTLTGGVATLYERLSPLLLEHGLDAVFGDSRLEVFAPARGQVVVLGVRRRPAVLDRDEFEQRMARLDHGGDLDTSFPPADVAAVDRAPRPLARKIAPGRPCQHDESMTRFRIDRLGDAETTLTERYDAAGNPEEAWVSCQSLDWRTDFLAPGTCRVPGERFECSLVWRIAQWEWLTERGSDLDIGRWVLRSHNTTTAAEVASLLSGSLAWWVRRATEGGIRLCQALLDGGEAAFEPALHRLSDELAGL